MIEFIYQVPTWRDSFVSGKTCLIPMQTASESSYFGTHAGNMIRFSQKNQDIFFVTGIYSEWVNKETGEVKETFALLTDDPYEFFFNAGHDRSVVVIDENKYENWLFDKTLKPNDRLDFLRTHRVNLDWAVDVDRPMKSGWEKRAPSAKDLEAIRVWKPSRR
jgi:putative SOS response-associated peptidase YedK